MDFNRMIETHLRWKEQLKKTIEAGGAVDPGVIEYDDRCELGEWIHGAGTMHAGVEAYDKLKGRHARFHVCAAQVARLANSAPLHALRSLASLSGDFGHASHECIRAIEALRDALSGEG